MRRDEVGDRRREVLDAASTIHALADRIGRVEREMEVPSAVLRQKWSTLNVPLMWAAAGTNADTPVLRWLLRVAAHMPYVVDVVGQEMTGRDALQTAWVALRAAMRSWGVNSPAELSTWLAGAVGNGGRRFPCTAPGGYLTRQAQEYVLQRACAHDARVAALEGMYAEVTLSMSRQPQGPEWAAPALPPVARPLGGEPTPQAEHDPGPDEEQCVRPARDLPPRYWQQLDEIHLEQELRKPVRTVREPHDGSEVRS